MAFSFQQPRATTNCRLFYRHLRTARHPVPSDHEQQQLFQSRPVAGNHVLEAGLEQGLEGMGRLYDCKISRTRTDPR